MKGTLLALLLILCTTGMMIGQNDIWTYKLPSTEETKQLQHLNDSPWKNGVQFYLSPEVIQSTISNSSQKDKHSFKLNIPLNKEESVVFELRPYNILPENLSKKYPNIRTYQGRSPSNKLLAGRFSYSSKGFHGIISSPEGTYFMDPHPSKKEGYFHIYNIKDNEASLNGASFECGDYANQDYHSRMNESEILQTFLEPSRKKSASWPLKVYTVAVACTGEYTQFHGGTVEDGLSAIVVTINRLNQVFERDLGIRLRLMENNDQLVFTNPATDPYSNGNSSEMLGQNINYMRVNLDQNAFDIGHVFGTNNVVSGVAYRASTCINFVSAVPDFNKAGGVSQLPSPEGDAFTIAVAGHEFGHQLGASHSFSSCQEVNPSTSYEPGGGTTIMAYAGICQSINNLQFFTDDYYHTGSLDQILAYTRTSNGQFCGEDIPSENIVPDVNIPLQSGFYIPISTPFKLNTLATDQNNDSLTYCWEQYDIGPINNPPGSPAGNSPLFRSFQPTTNSERIFPSIEKIVFDRFDRSEVLPTYSRDLTFRCTVRDNNESAGAVNWDQISFQSTEEAGPFDVLTPANSNTSWIAGNSYEVQWDVANTNGSLVDCQFVNILLSLDGGFTYPISLVQSTPNDGSAFVNIPNVTSSIARVMVEASNNIFFDISSFDFRIIAPETASVYATVTPSGVPAVCLPESVNFEVFYQALLNYEGSIEFDLIGDLPEEAVFEFSDNNVTPNSSLNSINLKLDLPNVEVNTTYNLQVAVIPTGLDTIFQDIQVNTLSTDLSAVAPLDPADGSKGLANQLVSFNWEGSPNADSYTFELATNPTFGDSTVLTANQLTDTSFDVENILEPNTIYYWRIQPNQNSCGTGDYSKVNVLQTVTSLCSTYESMTSVNISGSGRPTIQSSITVPSGGAIEDVNIPIIEANYQPIKSLKISLLSPESDEVVLYDQECGNTVIFRSGFDDEAISTINCPPDDRIPFRPKDSLAAFNGQLAAGEWTLQVQVVASGFGASGALDNWAIEFCSQQVPSAPALSLEMLMLEASENKIITRDLLNATDQRFMANDLTYILVNNPEHGNLLLNGQIIQNGDQFSQQDINDNRLNYTHNGDLATTDAFTFIVRNPEGGWVGSVEFPISIDQSNVTSTTEIGLESAILIFPNPADQSLNVSVNQPLDDEAQILLYDLSGRLKFTDTLDGYQTKSISTASFTDGLYILQVRDVKQIVSKKVVIEH